MSSNVSSIEVHTFCSYLSAGDELKWRDEDYKALFMVKAIKGDPFNGYVELNIGGSVKKYYQKDSQDFRAICHRPLVKIVKNNFPEGGTIVPIPSSKTTSEGCHHFITLEIAQRLAKACGPEYDCKPLLLFKEEMTSSRKGGSRSPYHIESNYKLNGSTKKPIILFDDVVTLGGHLKAAYWKLSDAGMQVIGAITFAKTVKENGAAAFGPFSERLEVERAATLWD